MQAVIRVVEQVRVNRDYAPDLKKFSKAGEDTLCEAVICFLLAKVFSPGPHPFQVCWITQLH
uniref:Uncharacterized protein n=1 Tax=Pyxicephalus adspersus TaxID=30357 RepID=A0A499QU56_PYXAD|nr:hypothetical protein maker-240M17-exonerate_protein2genome-gene-0.5 [Pyxicephalus adspersus]AWH61112.1 hypothetical protein maker-33C18-exonerate_protein2genome-gene-0.7 [Pyxicephalus adspersus]